MGLTVTIPVLVLFVVGVFTFIHLLLKEFRRRRARKDKGLTVGIFHPYCNAGGGGEKVLWCAIRALQNKYPDINIAVYTGDVSATPDEILGLAAKRLNTTLPRPIHFVYLRTRTLVEARWYPVFTLLGQSLGSAILGMEAMWRYLPDIYLDTMGYAFTYPLFSVVGACQVACYVHYPTITPDMLQRVSDRVEAHNNRAVVARSPLLTGAKLLYYKIFAWLYKKAGNSADVVMVNSSWTKGHIEDLWKRRKPVHLVYPPCDIEPLKKIHHKESAELRIVSLGQFRPEKDHPKQIRAMAVIKSLVPVDVWPKVKLVLVGSCRDAQDEARVKTIKSLCEELNVRSNVEFRVNISFDELQEQLSRAVLGLHTMWNEHFGIGVVECMAARLIMLSHRSGGPLMDIIDEREESRTGYLADTAEEYAETVVKILNISQDQLDVLRARARKSMDRFSIISFEDKFTEALSPLLDDEKKLN